MYNYQTFLRENRIKVKCEQIRKDHIDTSQNRQNRMPSMIQSHKKRIEGFILAMVEKPLRIDQYRHSTYKPRPSLDKQKLTGTHKAFYMNHHIEKDRLEEEVKRNSVYDEVPYHNTATHQFRQLKATSQTKPMKFTTSTSSLRVKQSLQKQTLNYLSTSKNRKVQHLIKTQCKTLNTKALTKLINKSLLPSLHQKTHFHSIKTIYSDSPCGFLKINPQTANTIEKEPISHQTYDDETQVQARKDQQKGSNDHVNRKENSKEALIKCGLLRILPKNGITPNTFSSSYSTEIKQLIPKIR